MFKDNASGIILVDSSKSILSLNKTRELLFYYGQLFFSWPIYFLGSDIVKAVVLFSGGLDSTTCLAKAIQDYGKDNVFALSLLYGQRHDKEISCAQKIAEYYGIKQVVIDLSTIFENSDCSLLKTSKVEVPTGPYSGGIETTYVPYRNGLFLSVATSYALANNYDVVIYGIHHDDEVKNAYPDTSIEFDKAISDACYLGSGKKIRIEAPFVSKNKADIVKLGLELNVPYELTWSCYQGHDKACGKCATCLDRLAAFEANNRKDPLPYE